jgi:hypothetical protein
MEVDLPEPADPTNNTKPLSSSAISCNIDGKFNSLIDMILSGI